MLIGWINLSANLENFYSNEPANEKKTFPVIIQLYENTKIIKLDELTKLFPYEEETVNIISMNYIGAKITPRQMEKLFEHPAVARIHTD